MTPSPGKLSPTVIAVISLTLLLAPLMAQSPTAVNSKPATAGQAVSFDRGWGRFGKVCRNSIRAPACSWLPRTPTMKTAAC